MTRIVAAALLLLPASAATADEPLTLDLTRHIRSGRWRLLRIHDGLRPRTA